MPMGLSLCQGGKDSLSNCPIIAAIIWNTATPKRSIASMVIGPAQPLFTTKVRNLLRSAPKFVTLTLRSSGTLLRISNS